jgi:hypothetical protein
MAETIMGQMKTYGNVHSEVKHLSPNTSRLTPVRGLKHKRRKTMFDNTGLDRSFLADVHNVAVHLKEIKELLQVVLPYVVNNGLKVTHQDILQVTEPTQSEPPKGKWKCVYEENGHVIESSEIDADERAAWFRDSYNHHTGHQPSNVSVNGFVHGVEAVDQTGGLQRVWHCFSIDERKEG